MRTRQLSGWLASLRRLGEDQQGAAMMILGLAVIPLFVLMGLAVDVGRGYMVKSKLSYAIDSAGLAGGRAFETDLREEDIMMFFEANFPPNYMESDIEGGKPTVIFNDQENTILIEATAIVPTRFMGVAGVHEMRVHARTLIQRELQGMELALVMDNTGSMRGSKMSAMKDAATDLVNILYGSRDEIENFWVALVPYAATVNIGSQHTDWLIQQSYDPDAAWQNADPDSSERFGYHPDHFQPTTWKGCVEARGYPRDSNDDPPSVEGWYPHLWRTTLRNFENVEWEFDEDEYVIIVKNEDVDPVTKSSNRLYTQGAPEHSGDDPEDVEYDPNDRETWGPYIQGDNEWDPDGPLSSLREDNNDQNRGTGPNLGCGPAITPLVTQKSVVQAAIDEMQPWHRGGTMANLGLAWGWRVLSPRWRTLWDDSADPALLPLDYDEPNMEKVVILLTDGNNEWYDWMGPEGSSDAGGNCSSDNDGLWPPRGLPGDNNSKRTPCRDLRTAFPGADYTGYARLSEGRLGTTNKGTAENLLDSRMLEMCTAMKNAGKLTPADKDGIIIYTITFGGTPNSGTQTLYRNCATTPDKYFHAPSESVLKQAFVQIADELSNLRIAE
jgi:Flp pilus assembly protein TadG